MYLEIGYDQGESVPKLLRNTGWSDIKVRKDFANRDRVVSARISR
jgi:methylase of polypeptide subunit release factors